MSWFQAGVSVVSAIVGGFVGGWVVAFRLGRWQQLVEDRLAAAEKRLKEGDQHVDQVPILMTRVDVIIETLGEIKQTFRDFAGQVVTHKECDRRHGLS